MAKGIKQITFLMGFWSCLIFFLSGCTESTYPEKVRPNILFAIADDVSFPHMGVYGTSWIRTPAFDRIAREGILCARAYTPNAKCAPSRAILLTGRNSWQLEEAANHWCHFPDTYRTVWEALQHNGYHTGHVAKGWAPGTVSQIEGEPRELVGKSYNMYERVPPTSSISVIDYATNFEAFLQERDADQPFAFWYGGYEPHRGYDYGSGVRIGGKSLEEIDTVFGFFPDSDTVRNDLLDYAYEIEYFDQHLEKMLAVLETSGLLDNTLIIVTADNGMPFPRVKGQAYERSNHVPLAMRWGNGIHNPGREIREIISFTDFAPTLLEIADISLTQSGMQPFEGISLTTIFKDTLKEVHRSQLLIGKERHDVGRPGDVGYPIRGLVTEDYLFLINFEPDRWPAGNPETGYLNCDGGATKSAILDLFRNHENEDYWNWSFGKRPAEELYFIKEDPDCLNNLSGQSSHQEIQQLLKTQLIHELKEQKDPRILGHGEIFDHYAYQDSAHQNFFERFKKGELDRYSAGWVNPSDFEK